MSFTSFLSYDQTVLLQQRYSFCQMESGDFKEIDITSVSVKKGGVAAHSFTSTGSEYRLEQGSSIFLKTPTFDC